MRAILVLAILVLTILAAWAMPARAQLPAAPDTPVCRRTEVLDLVGRELRKRVTYADIDPATIYEAPTEDGAVVQCSVCLEVRAFDTERSGPVPAVTCQLHRYAVRTLPGGFSISDVE